MISSIGYHVLFGVILALVIVMALGRTWWVYRGSSDWPTADGTVIFLDVQRKEGSITDGGHYFSATFTYQFVDLVGDRKTGTWYKNFSTELDAQDFATRELPLGKQVLVRFNPKDSNINNLELDSSVYTDDRPISLGL